MSVVSTDRGRVCVMTGEEVEGHGDRVRRQRHQDVRERDRAPQRMSAEAEDMCMLS